MQKKIISLICALTMVFSMFSAVSVSAAGEKGMALSGSLSNDGKEVTIKVDALNAVGGLWNAAVSFAVPAGVTDDDVSFTADSGFAMQLDAVDSGIYTLALLTIGTTVTPRAELATIKIKFDEPLANNLTITLSEKSGFQDSEGSISVGNGTMDAASVTIKKWSGA